MSLDDLDVAELRRRQSEKWGRHGGDVLGLGIAEMDFPLAEPVRQVLVEAVERGDCGYVDSGNLALQQAFAGFAADEWGWTVDPDGVLPATDVMLGIERVLMRVTEPGEPVVITPPVYPPYFVTINGIGRRVAEVPLVEGRLDLAGIGAAFAAGGRAMLLCNPHNPTGRVVPADELRELAAIAARHGATVIADEIHAPLVLGDATHQPFLALGGEAAEVGVTVTSTSKGWNLAALKCAVIVTADGPQREVVATLGPNAHDRVGYLGWLASVAAWNDGREWLAELRSILRRNRDLLAQLLAEQLPQARYTPGDAGYLAWIDFREMGLGDDPAAELLERTGVALTHGPPFGRPGRGHARLNFATSEAILREAVARLARR
ncbi:MAG TPA: aminotransferase class I/II-fold pyridoxal phosphate-dependent enzyme [Gaiellales bacterium]|nr:aminotransferase class I/II-fold pyridoxal phosphate-dependent enzyme [Gaiellales bacterium]